MVDATQYMGLGWDVRTSVGLGHIVDARQGIGLGGFGVGCDMVDATQDMGLGSKIRCS